MNDIELLELLWGDGNRREPAINFKRPKQLKVCKDHDKFVVIFDTQQSVTCPVCDKDWESIIQYKNHV